MEDKVDSEFLQIKANQFFESEYEMAYQTPITIKEAIDKINRRQYVLPSIQREFVWGIDQIETLFDSLMRNYPIGTFLFWEVDKDKIEDFQFYAFLEKYHEKDYRHNPKVNITNSEDIIALLDGQQRMTSMYLALNRNSYYAYKKPRMARKNPRAYPKRKLHLNLLKPSDELEVEYDFRFLTEEDARKQDEGFYWFECPKILSFKDKSEIIDYIDNSDLSGTPAQIRFARITLDRFYDVVHKDGTISYYLEKDEELDKVLQIFIRINSAGTTLTYSDLLLSIATAQWKEKDAREVIHEFVDEINRIGGGFNFNKDLVLKNCLVLAGFKDIRFKVDNFSKSNMKTIEEDWERTSSSLRAAVGLVAKFGYSEASLISTNAIIPIAYFIYKNGLEDQILDSSQWENDRKAIKEWLARALFKGMFGGTPDSIYPRMRDLIDENVGSFPLEKIITAYRKSRRSISFNSDDIDSLLELQHGKAKTYCALTLIYPNLDHSLKYEQDHIHPKSKFHKKSMKEFSDEDIKQFNAKADSIANLQLLLPRENQEKKDKTLKEWLDSKFESNEAGKDRYLEQHHIRPDQSLEFEDFLDFIARRQKTIRAYLTSILGVTHEE